MYPLNVVIAGCSDEVLDQVRSELAAVHAHVEAEFPDLAAAAGRVQAATDWTGRQGRPDAARLFVVHLRSDKDRRDMGRLAQTFPGNPVVALLDPGEDHATVTGVMREGAAEVLLLPVQPEPFRAALDRAARPFGDPTGLPRVVAVAGVTGGCGATTVAVNLALEFADRYKVKCVLAELTPQMGVLADHLGLNPGLTLHDLLGELDRLDTYRVLRALTPAAEGLAVLAGPHGVIRQHRATARDVMQVIGLTRRVADVVVLDVPSAYDELYFHALSSADRAVLVGRQTVPAVRALKLVGDALAGRGVGRPPVPLLNRYDPRAKGLGADELAAVLGVPSVATVADDPRAAGTALNRGVPLRTQAPKSPAIADIAALARLLTQPEQAPAAKREGLSGVHRLFRAVGF